MVVQLEISANFKCLFRWVVETDFGGLKQWFPFLKITRHHSVYLPIGQAKVAKYCARYKAALQGDWAETPQVRTVAAAAAPGTADMCKLF